MLPSHDQVRALVLVGVYFGTPPWERRPGKHSEGEKSSLIPKRKAPLVVPLISSPINPHGAKKIDTVLTQICDTIPSIKATQVRPLIPRNGVSIKSHDMTGVAKWDHLEKLRNLHPREGGAYDWG